MACDVAQLHMLEVVPDPFIWVEVRCIAWQLRHAEPFGCFPSQERLDLLVPVDRRPIPDDQQPTVPPTEQMSEEAHHLWSLKRALLQLGQQLPVPGYPADDREMIA